MPDRPRIIARREARQTAAGASGRKARAGGKSGLHRAAQELTAPRREARIRATETSRLSAGETGNLCAQQHQIGT